MLKFIKKLIPTSIKIKLIKLKQRLLNPGFIAEFFMKKIVDWLESTSFYQRVKTFRYNHRIRRRHKLLLSEMKSKGKIKVVFLVIHKSVWKVDPVFRKMLHDPYFEPVIIVCPYILYGLDRMLEDLRESYNYFKCKGYPVINSYDEVKKTWVELEDISPDLVFFTNPHNLTKSYYYEDAYLNYLTCYVPYSFDVSRYDNYQTQYNQYFHNCMWRIFVPHQVDMDIYRVYSQTKGRNAILSGYPFVESILRCNDSSNTWKEQEKIKMKIIWAPHHTIDAPGLPYASFLKIADFMQKMAIEFAEDVQFAFKPHPILRSKLYNHIDWGKEKTDSFYSFWSNSNNTQYCDGEYTNLFINSDAMIHDCGSFLAEYLFVNKPVLYTSNLELSDMRQFYNDFGLSALDSHFIADGESQHCKIKKFIEDIINGEITINKNHETFIQENKICNSASDFILSSIRNSFN